jgi:hypothetical protein
MKTLLMLGLALLAAMLLVPTVPCAGAPLPPAAEVAAAGASHARAFLAGAARLRPGDSPAAGPVLPTFQAIGFFGDMAVVDAQHMLTPAVYVQTDSYFGSGAVCTGLAVSPTGTTFFVGNDGINSWLATVNFTTGAGTTIGEIAGYVINDIAFDGAGHLYGLTDNKAGTSPHSLLLINTATAAASVAAVLNNHGGTSDFTEYGAIAFNPADSSFYYADRDSSNHLFVDKLAHGTFTQTSVLTTILVISPTAMAFSGGKLWLSSFGSLRAADASNIAAGFTTAGFMVFPTPDGTFAYSADGLVPNTLPCVPSPTAACLYNRFKIEITYDATPNNGTGPANVVLESTASVKFTFFDPTVIEMILKVLDACALNNKWWVFGGGLTNVGVAIKVTDTATGAFQRYNSTKGQLFQTFADTSAFSCP